MFEIGTVLRLYIQDFVPPKVKYCIIVGNISDKIATVFINSEVNVNQLPNNLQALHHPVTPDDCSCLQYESFVNCSQIREWDKALLNNLLTKEPGRKECTLPAPCIKSILETISRAQTIPVADKKKFSLL